MSTQWKSVIDDVLGRARQSVGGDTGTTKVAGATSIVKEAQETADALQVAIEAAANDGSLAGAIKAAQLAKAAGEGAGSPVDSATSVSGTQGLAPASGKKKMPSASPSAPNPPQSSAMDGKMPENILRQNPNKSPDHSKGAAGQTLFELLTGEKLADSPVQGDAEQNYAATTNANEGSLSRFMNSESSIVNMTKRQAKAPTRARLAEVFACTNDTLSDATVKAIFPQAAAKGGLKIATADLRELVKAAAEASDAGYSDEAFHKDRKKVRRIYGALGGVAGGALGSQLSAMHGLSRPKAVGATALGAGGVAALSALEGHARSSLSRRMGRTSGEKGRKAGRVKRHFGNPLGLLGPDIYGKANAAAVGSPEKKASVREWLAVADAAREGALGEDAKALFAEAGVS